MDDRQLLHSNFRYSLRVELTCKIRLAIFSKKQYLGIYLVLEIA